MKSLIPSSDHFYFDTGQKLDEGSAQTKPTGQSFITGSTNRSLFSATGWAKQSGLSSMSIQQDEESAFTKQSQEVLY